MVAWEVDFAVVRLTLDSRVGYYFGLLNTRGKCDFLAFFPEEGTTKTEVLEARVFNTDDRRDIDHYMKPYEPFLNNLGRMGSSRGHKLYTLNEDGKNLQSVARFMVLMNHELNKSKRRKTDYLNALYFLKDSGYILEVFSKIYLNKVSLQADLCRFKRDIPTKRRVTRLEEFGLIKTKFLKRGGSRREIFRTDQGQQYFFKLFIPILEYFTATCETNNCELYKYMQNGHWETYVKKNGRGWNGRTKAS